MAAPPQRGRLARCALAVLAFSAVIVLPAGEATAAAAPGSIGLRLVDVPASAGDDPRAQLYIVDHLAPGTAIDRRIEVSNTTDAIAHVVLYAAAATIDHGSFLGAAGHTPNALSNLDVRQSGRLRRPRRRTGDGDRDHHRSERRRPR